MTQIGIMLEGQLGLNWTRWQRILKAAEDFGYQCVFRSDHFVDANQPDQDSLELWVALTYAASHTSRIEFGSLVTPITFRHPAITARMAAGVDDLSGGRLVLGMGAGWQDREHHNFGIPFYDVPTRHEMLTDGLEVVSRLLRSDEPVSYQGKHFSLDGAILLPRPQRRMPILIGGTGEKKTMPLVAKYADEWNGVFIPAETYKQRNSLLNDLLAKEGRKPGDVKRSIMTQVNYGETDAVVRAKLQARGTTPEALAPRGIMSGTASVIIDRLSEFVEAGVERFMLQWTDQDNIADLEKMARDVLPHFHK